MAQLSYVVQSSIDHSWSLSGLQLVVHDRNATTGIQNLPVGIACV